MEEKRNRKNIVSLVVLCVSIVALTTSLTYAYFVSQVGTNEQEKVTITSGTLSLTFRDNDETVENIEGSWNFGDTIEKELVIENTGTKDTYAKISWDNLINTYLAESLTYTLEEKTDEEGSTYKIIETEGSNVPRSVSASTVLLADHLEIPAGHTYIYRLRITFENLEDIDQTADLNANFITKFTIAENTKKLTTEEKLANLNIKINPNNTVNFANPATTDETADGLFSMEDDYGTSYYYRGTAPNNYIKFGKNASGQDMWWRIIRFNGDGSIRMQYDGAGTAGANTYTRGFALTSQPWNSKYNDAKYVGWMFGGAQGIASTAKMYEGETKPDDGEIYAQSNETNSEIKTAVEAWYKTNIVDTGYSKYIADAIFCNDRSTPGQSITNWTPDTGAGYGTNATAFGGWSRIRKGSGSAGIVIENPIPIFTCPQENDKFTVEESSGGNGASTYPVGLITVDEALAAGSGKSETTNSQYYLYKEFTYWTLSSSILLNTAMSSMLHISNTGALAGSNVNFNNPIAPVINLKSEYLNQLKGRGTIESPYYLETT